MAFRIRTLAPIAAIGILALAGCASDSDDASDATASDAPAAEEGLGSESDPVRLGVVGASDAYWQVYVDAAAAEGISVELVDFTEYTQPNPAVSQGDLDINQFQHVLYLADYNVSSGDDLVPIGATAIYPLGLYSDKYDDVADIVEDESKVTVEGLDASLVTQSLPDVAAAIVNNDYLEPAGLTEDDVLFADDPSDPSALPYVNIFATTAENADDEVLNKLVEIYQTNQDVLDGVLENSGGTAVFATTPKDELQAALEDVEADAAAAN